MPGNQEKEVGDNGDGEDDEGGCDDDDDDDDDSVACFWSLTTRRRRRTVMTMMIKVKQDQKQQLDHLRKWMKLKMRRR